MESKDLMRLALSLSKRAESYDAAHLAASFVEIGHIPTLLKNNDSAIIFGRRGTGKTHLLSHLSTQIDNSDVICISVDMRTIGSSSGLYSDTNINLAERATRLLRDTANSIHEKILEKYTEPKERVFGDTIMGALDEFIDASNYIQLTGPVTLENTTSIGRESESVFSVSAGSTTSPTLGINIQDKQKNQEQQNQKRIETGNTHLTINFGSLTKALEKLVSNLPKKRLWILLDEWSEVPTALQPYLADMLRRGFLAVKGTTIKIAAIEHRSNFRNVSEETKQSIGIEIGADVAMSINLDDHMVFDNDSTESSKFFAQMLFNHMKSIAASEKVPFPVSSGEELVRHMFTQTNCFNEFVRAAEGVPRDAINILSKCALNSNSDKVSMQTVRAAARNWYTSSKRSDIASRPHAVALLDWIISEVIGARKARGFLLDSRVKDELIDFLFDSRVLHIIKRDISSKDREDSGKKFNAWTIDYGCYVDLFNTASAPRGLFQAEEEEALSTTKYVDVHQTDYRSIRRAILDVDAFHSQKGMQDTISTSDAT